MKAKARESFTHQLSKVCREENIDIDIQSLSDKELKELYLKLQTVRSSKFPYGISKGDDLLNALEENRMQFISFRDYHKFGVRRLTFKEFLLLVDIVENNPNKYSSIKQYIH